MRLRFVILLPWVLVIVLAVIVWVQHSTYSTTSYTGLNGGPRLLSPRIYSGILQPESFLILNFEPLENKIRQYISESDANISVYVLNMRDGASFGIGENKTFEPASLNKLPVAIIILRKVEQGQLSLQKIVEIKESNRDTTSKAGPLKDSAIKRATIEELLNYMLAYSDNTAFWTLGEYVTLEDLQHLSSYLNYYEDDINYTSPKSNIYEVTPKSMANFFSSLYLSTVLQPEHSEFILRELTRTLFDIKKHASLPSDVIVAQKYGSYYGGNERFFHSCGILYIKDSRIFYCVMTEGLHEDKAMISIGNIVHEIYSYVAAAKKRTNL